MNGVIARLLIIFLLGDMVVMLGCKKDQPIEPLSEEASNATQEGKGEQVPRQLPPVPEGHLRLDDPNAPPVLVQMNGVFHEVFEIAEKPYNGKQVEYHPGGVEKREVIYEEGRLMRVTEWHDNGNKRMEVKIGLDGARQESYWDEAGKPTQRHIALARARGRDYVWTLRQGQRPIDVLYQGKGMDFVTKVFGKPDEKQNDVWIYRGMKVQTTQGLMTTVRFVMRNDVVFQITVEP